MLADRRGAPGLAGRRIADSIPRTRLLQALAFAAPPRARQRRRRLRPVSGRPFGKPPALRQIPRTAARPASAASG